MSTSKTTQTLTPSPPFSTIRDETNEEEELASRGLLNSDFSLIKKVVGEQGVVSVAGLTALLLQIAHPSVGRGVGDHSGFSDRLVERTEYTAMYTYMVVYGTPEEKAKVKAFVDRRHGWVNDRKKTGGRGTYDALDPELQLWVAATLYATYVPAYEAIFGPLSSTESEQMLQEFSVMGTSLQVPLHMWPRSVAAFWEYFDDVVENTLEMTPQCEKTTRVLRNPVRLVPWYFKPLFFVTTPLHWNAATENFPPRARELYGLKSTPASRWMHAVGMATIRGTYPLYPAAVRQFPKNYYMYLARKRMKKGKMD